MFLLLTFRGHQHRSLLLGLNVSSLSRYLCIDLENALEVTLNILHDQTVLQFGKSNEVIYLLKCECLSSLMHMYITCIAVKLWVWTIFVGPNCDTMGKIGCNDGRTCATLCNDIQECPTSEDEASCNGISFTFKMIVYTVKSAHMKYPIFIFKEWRYIFSI